MTQAERDTHQAQQQAMKVQRDADVIQRHQAARDSAASLLNQADQVGVHPYLTTKGIQSHGIKVFGNNLLIPLRDTSGDLHSLQTIGPDGAKRFHPGGRVTGCYHSIGKPAGVLIVCEGFATGASLQETTGHAVAVAFNAGNLEPVALALRAKYPTLKFIIAADDDHLTDGNPGLTKARAAAQAVGGWVAIPLFPAGRPDKATDFNDLHTLAGGAAVKARIDAAIEPVTSAKDEVARGQMDLWPEPTPLPSALPPVDPFDAELLPVALRAWAIDIANLMQCPPDFTAVGAIAAISSLIGARAVVQPKSKVDWHVVPNLWALIVGRPGVMKSPALSEVMKPLNRLESKERELWQAEHDAWELDCKVTAMQDEANERKAKGYAAKGETQLARQLLEPTDTPAEPAARCYVVNDSTVAKLGETMEANEWGVMVYRDELYGLLTSLDKQGEEEARGFYLQGYDGNQGYKVQRISRGEHYIPRVCMSMLGGTQPGKVQRYVRDAVSGGSGDDGLLQRFGLTVWPDVAREFKYVDQLPDAAAKQTAWAVFERLAALQPANDTEPVIWRFDEVAQALFIEWLVPFETEIRGDDLHPAMVSHLSKYRKLIPALALVFALIDTPDSGAVIHEGELLRALAFGDYLRSHANRLYAAALMPETTDAATLLSRIKAGKLVDRDGVILDSFTPRQVAQKCWSGLGTPDAVRKAAEILVDFDWLRRDVAHSSDAKGRGRPSERFVINPYARGLT
jgi:putative DNA primase/helicase